jgi:peptidoglycan/LPS O-acetylase OafA/YrhL
MFLSGAAFRMFGASAGSSTIAMCSLVSLAMLFGQWTWEIGFATFGSVAVIGAGLKPAQLKIPDISYGVYLYGWPVQKLLVFAGLASPWILFPVALTGAALCGAASWFCIERYALRLKTSGRAASGAPNFGTAQ